MITYQECYKYIVTILNIDTTSLLVKADIEAELHSILDFAGFVKYVKDNIKNEDLRYLNGYSKFISLVRDFDSHFKKQIISQNKTNISKRVNDITNKIEALNYSLESDCRAINENDLKNFSQKDIKILKKFESLNQVVYKFKANRKGLEVRLYDILESAAVEVEVKRLVNNTRLVTQSNTKQN